MPFNFLHRTSLALYLCASFLLFGCSKDEAKELENQLTGLAYDVWMPMLSDEAAELPVIADEAQKKGYRPVQIRTLEGVAPNIIGSPSVQSWFENALRAARKNRKAGTAGTPSYFEDIQNATAADFIVTDFPSWRGRVNPAVEFGPDFANELGNRVHNITLITDRAGGKVDISEGLTIAVAPNPFIPKGLTFGPITTYLGFPFLYGLDYGPDGKADTPDDIVFNSGNGPVDEIVVTFPGLGLLVTNRSGDPVSEQASIDAGIMALKSEGRFSIESTFLFRKQSGTSRLNVNR